MERINLKISICIAIITINSFIGLGQEIPTITIEPKIITDTVKWDTGR